MSDKSIATELSSISTAAADVLAERRRQVEVEGWTAEHDDQHRRGQLASAGAAYAMGVTGVESFLTRPGQPTERVASRFWPWSDDWWKPKDRRHNLVRAAALLIAEIERLDRAAERAGGEHG
ncbi:MAG: hypothetical protein K0S56_389 [Microvirga sp.]|nr:hypothetical protein [Microvirga sp.]